jgi:hypothetical protein
LIFKSFAISANWASAGLACHAIASRLAEASREGWLTTAEGLRRFESPASPFRLRYGGGDDVSFFVISACQHLVFSLSAE